MEAYFDNSATTVVTENVKDIVVKVMTQDYGNPSSMHMVGVNAENILSRPRKIYQNIKNRPERNIFYIRWHRVE